jgi:hypothetical protein
MSTAHINFLRWSSWASLVVPLIAYVLCSEVSTGHFFSHAPLYGRNIPLLRHYAFLVSTIIGGLVLLGDVGFKRWLLLWLPLVSLLLTYLLYVGALEFEAGQQGLAEPGRFVHFQRHFDKNVQVANPHLAVWWGVNAFPF